MGIVLALLLGASGSCCDGKCPAEPPAASCEGGQCGVKGSGKKVVVAAKSVRKTVRSRSKIFRRRK